MSVTSGTGLAAGFSGGVGWSRVLGSMVACLTLKTREGGRVSRGAAKPLKCVVRSRW